MNSTFGQINPLYLETYFAVVWVGFASLFLVMDCREKGFVTWGTLLFGGGFIAPLMTVVAPMFLLMAAIFFVMWVCEKTFGWIGRKIAPLLNIFRPLWRLLERLGGVILRKMNGRAFSCTSLQAERSEGGSS